MPSMSACSRTFSRRSSNTTLWIFFTISEVVTSFGRPLRWRWIGRGGPVNWPARSPDLSCLDFFLWGHMKSLVYSSPVYSNEALVARIAVVAGDIREMLGVFSNVRQSLHRRWVNLIKALLLRSGGSQTAAGAHESLTAKHLLNENPIRFFVSIGNIANNSEIFQFLTTKQWKSHMLQ
ncbi:uncharacterized protein TNCV_5045471 [Trichonephila clavipes]|uniref:Uncharacterized protein n=1 Tax=Trichonephila clavipes TaxID=2585209 RepID=A0A8X6WIJ4_TRICX|nr:uncharacterized protein TNCV_5045471 [Trichonephila clavipes]